MHVFVSAGEPSGDLHAANLVRALRDRAPGVRVSGFGGHHLQAAGADVHYPLADLAVMGVWPVVRHLPTFFRVARRAEVYFRSARPDAVVVIDFPGFHWAVAKRAHRAGVPVYYFVPPQLWAWAGWRVRKMRWWVDTVLAALPFEDEWYRARGVNTRYVGHPYFDELADQRIDAGFVAARKSAGGPLVALLPGSRSAEVADNFPLMVAAAARVREAVPGVRFLVAAYKDRHAAACRAALAGSGLPAEVCVGRTAEIIEAADAAVAVSGSVGLELMCRHTPTVVVYKVTPAGAWLGRRLRTCRYISLVNLLADAELFPEFLTTGWIPDDLARPVVEWLRDPAARQKAVTRLAELKARVAVPGACGRAADLIVGQLIPRSRVG